MKVDTLNDMCYDRIKTPYFDNALPDAFYNSNETTDTSLHILHLIDVYEVICNVIIATENRVKLIIV